MKFFHVFFVLWTILASIHPTYSYRYSFFNHTETPLWIYFSTLPSKYKHSQAKENFKLFEKINPGEQKSLLIDNQLCIDNIVLPKSEQLTHANQGDYHNMPFFNINSPCSDKTYDIISIRNTPVLKEVK